MADIKAWNGTSGDAPWISAWEAYLYGRAGRQVKAQHALGKLTELNRSWHLHPERFLDVAYAGITDKDKWLASLENAYRNHSHVLTDLKLDSMYDPLRAVNRASRTCCAGRIRQMIHRQVPLRAISLLAMPELK